MPNKSRPVRVGMIRCDTHGYWYAHLFDRPDAALMRQNHWGCHYYFFRWDDPNKPRITPVPGMAITKVFDEEDRAKAEGLAEALGGRAQVCDTYEEVSDEVDLVYVADCNYEGEDHLRFATPGLKKGVPHFVDKPFAFTLKDARALIDLANENGTAVMCSSLLRQSPHLKRFSKRFPDIAPIGSLVVAAGGPSLAGVFHGISVVQNVMGEGCEWVESMGANLYDVLRLHYPGPAGGTEAIVYNAAGNVPGRKVLASTYHHCAYTASAYGAGGAIHSPLIDDYLFPEAGVPIVKMAKRMAQTRQPPIAYDSMLELMEMIEAARLAHNKGKRVALAEVREMPQFLPSPDLREGDDHGK